MGITKSDVVTADAVAVFTRGHPDQMEETARRESDALTTFRSKRTWRSVKNASIWRDDDIVVYYCPIGMERVQYSATLEDILLDPTSGTNQTERFLETQLDVHRQVEDGLWEDSGGVNTLYRVTRFSPVDEPFPFTALRKIDGNEPLKPDYGYSYSIVHRRG